MAKLYGRLQGDQRKETTKTGSRRISATLETWEGQIRVELKDDGNFYVYVEEKGAYDGRAVMVGNVNEDNRTAVPINETIDRMNHETTDRLIAKTQS